MRCILTSFTWWPTYDNIMRAAWDNDLRAIGLALSNWIDYSAAATLRETHQDMIHKLLLRDGRILDNQVAKAVADPECPMRVQACIKDLLHRRETPLDPSQVLAKRWKRWFPPGLAFSFADKVIGTLRTITNQVPLCASMLSS